jgi:protein O-mannosyl-transferase
MIHSPSSTRRFAALLFLIVLFGYAGTLEHPFVYDDRTTVLLNPSIRSLADLRAVLLHNLTRPLVNLSYAIDWAISGARPIAYHATSIALHLANVLLLFSLAQRLLGDRRVRLGLAGDPPADRLGALLAAALFAAHPMMTEAVGYVSGRAGVLAAGFSIAALLMLRAALVQRRRALVAGGVAAWVLGLACKESAAMFPFALFAYDELLLPATPVERRGRRLRVHLPLIGLVIAAGVLRLMLFARLESGVRPMSEHLLTQLVVLWRYLLLLVVPYRQSIAHSVHPPALPVALIAFAGLVALAAWLWRARRRAPDVVFAATWFALFITPSSLVPLAEHMSEHRVYEASAGLFLLAGAGWLRLREPVRESRLGRLAPIAAILVLVALTASRNRVWGSPIRLWSDGVRNAPDLWTAHYVLGNEYQFVGRCQDALPEYQEAIRIKPSGRALVNVGVCLAQLGRHPEAERIFETALRIGAGAAAHYNLGLLLASRGRAADARDHLRQALVLDPAHIPALKALVDLEESVFHDNAETLRLCRQIERLDAHTAGVADCIRKYAP